MKSTNEINKHGVLLFLFRLLIISLGFSSFYIYVGYSIKPYMFVLLLIIAYFIKNKDLKITDFLTYEKMLILFFIVASLTVLQFRFTVPVLRYMLAFVFIIVLYLVVRKTCYILNKEEIEKSISIGGLIIAISSIIYYIMGLFAFNFYFHYNGIQKYGIICDRGIPRLVTLFNADPNISVFVTALFFFYYLCNLNKKYSKIGLVLTGAMILLTFSRGAYIGVIIPIIFLIFKDKKSTLFKKTFIVAAMIISLVCFNYFMTKYFNISISDTIASRFYGLSQDSGSGRMTLWKNAVDTFLDHPIFGIGINSTIYYSEPIYGSNHYVHNVYLEVLSETGIVGFSVFMAFIILTFKKYNATNKINQDNIYLYITFFSYIVQMIFVSVLLTEMMYIMLAISTKYFFSVNDNKKGSEICE